MAEGQDDDNIRELTPEERLALIDEKRKEKQKIQDEKLSVIESRAAEIQKRQEEEAAARAEKEKAEAAAKELEGLSDADKERLAKIEAGQKDEKEKEDRIKRLERVSAMEEKMAAAGIETTASTQQATYTRARGARIGSWLFYILLAGGIVMLIPDLLRNLAGEDILGGMSGWLFEPMESPIELETVIGLGFLGIIFIAASIVILLLMMYIYRQR